MAAATLVSMIGASACAPEENRISAAVQSTSDWMNNVDQAPPPNPWRLTARPDLTTGSYPLLKDVPAKPNNLPQTSEVNAKIAALQASGPTVDAVAGGAQRPDAQSLGSPVPATVTPIDIPATRSANSRPAASPPQKPVQAAALAQQPSLSPPPQVPAEPPRLPAAAQETTLDLDAEGPDWFNAKAKEAIDSFAGSQVTTATLILLMVEAPAPADDTVNLVRDRLVSSGIPQERISVNFRKANLRKVGLRTLGQ